MVMPKVEEAVGESALSINKADANSEVRSFVSLCHVRSSPKPAFQTTANLNILVPTNLRIMETDSKLWATKETALVKEIAITTTSDHLLPIVDSSTPARKSL